MGYPHNGHDRHLRRIPTSSFSAESLCVSGQLRMVAGGNSAHFTAEDFNIKMLPKLVMSCNELCVFLATPKITTVHPLTLKRRATSTRHRSAFCEDLQLKWRATSRQTISRLLAWQNLGIGRIATDRCNWAMSCFANRYHNYWKL